MRVFQGDNLETMRRLAAQGERFDFIECDGPYGEGLEGWDDLNEREYLAHYAERLPLMRELLKPWGITFFFGWPEGCAEVKALAREKEWLECRRWLHWYNQLARHAARKIQVILMLTQCAATGLPGEFKAWLAARRAEMGISIKVANEMTQLKRGGTGGYMWFESPSADVPSVKQYLALKKFFGVPDKFDALCHVASYDGLTNVDVLRVGVAPVREHLNDDGLRSKPIELYHRLFNPLGMEGGRALVLYGGSGNAAVVAEALGYDVTVCEQDPERAARIQGRTADVTYWKHRYGTRQAVLPALTTSEALFEA